MIKRWTTFLLYLLSNHKISKFQSLYTFLKLFKINISSEINIKLKDLLVQIDSSNLDNIYFKILVTIQ